MKRKTVEAQQKGSASVLPHLMVIRARLVETDRTECCS
eukprot:SAG22_NODE_59_length_23617_cov_252.868144_10_plen_38_part_00